MQKPSFINSFISFSVRATRQRLLLSTTKGSSKGRADRVAGGSSSRAAFLRLLALAKRVLHAVLPILYAFAGALRNVFRDDC